MSQFIPTRIPQGKRLFACLCAFLVALVVVSMSALFLYSRYTGPWPYLWMGVIAFYLTLEGFRS